MPRQVTDRFVIAQNIERFRRRLACESNDLVRMIIADLLMSEEDKLTELEQATPATDRSLP